MGTHDTRDPHAADRLLATANQVLPSAAHERLAAHPSVHVRIPWAARGDVPAELALRQLAVETDDAVRMLLQTLPTTPPQRPRAGDPWQDAAYVMHPLASDDDTEEALSRLEANWSVVRPWDPVIGMLSATLRGYGRHDRVVGLLVHSGALAWAARGARPSKRLLSRVLAACAVDGRSALVACHLEFDGGGEREWADALRGTDLWADAVADVLDDPLHVWTTSAATARSPLLPVMFALRAACSTSRSAAVQHLLEQAPADRSIRDHLAGPLVRNPHLDPERRSALIDVAAGILPEACPPRGPSRSALSTPAAVAGLPCVAVERLSAASAGDMLVPVSADTNAWHAVTSLWPEWNGSVADLLHAAQAL